MPAHYAGPGTETSSLGIAADPSKGFPNRHTTIFYVPPEGLIFSTERPKAGPPHLCGKSTRNRAAGKAIELGDYSTCTLILSANSALLVSLGLG